MRDYRRIDAWAKADDLAVSAYEHTRSFPREEVYGLNSQLRRSAASVASNIAEGSARGSTKEYLRFLYMARGSLAEAQYFVHLSNRLGYLSKDQDEALRQAVKAAFVRLHGLISAVEQEVG
jgi:four helix bundle protein